MASPEVTTRYHLRITSPEGVVDTASFLVKVEEKLKQAPAADYHFPTLLTGHQPFLLHQDLQGSTLKIYNQNGQVVKQYSRYDNSWRAESLASGMYNYSLENEMLQLRHRGKVVVVR